jgi:cyclopropane fatty-acyl-phospholipid synthase-like methyltransferase
MSSKWLQQWQGRTSALSRATTEDYYRVHGQELTALFPALADGARVLELGCGNGDLYAWLGFQRLDYTGVDFSSSMLADFRTRHPDTTLLEADAITYADSSRYDLIFCNGMAQYLRPAEFTALLSNARSMLRDSGTIVVGSIPLSCHRLNAALGRLMPPYKRPLLRSVKPLVAGILKRDGNWYGASDLVDLGENCGFKVGIYGSAVYLYRVHATFRK